MAEGRALSGELQPETVYDSGYRPSFDSARDVLAFMLTPVDIIGPMTADERVECLAMLNEAKVLAFVEWQRRQKPR